jgi:DNA-binding protein HU-beta
MVFVHCSSYGYPQWPRCPAEIVCVGGAEVNKAQLIDALAERLGDKKVAAAAVAALVDVVVRTVNGGERVTITGFGVFEKRTRTARTARNPRTGQTVTVQQTDVPAFRPGTLFREVVRGTRMLPEAGVTKAAKATKVKPKTTKGNTKALLRPP